MSRKQYWLKLDYLRLLSDEKLKVCSLEEQGLWLRLLCQAARSPRQGYLLLTGKVKPTNAQLARIIGVDEEKIANILASSLIPLGLISQTRGKVLYFKNWRKYQRGRTLAQDCVGPYDDTALDQKKPLDKDKDKEREEEAGTSSLHPLAFVEIISKWNAIDGQYVHTSRKPTKKRLTAFRNRMKETGWYADAVDAIQKIKRGECGFFGHNDRNWKADIDWFLKPDSVTRILEGKYEGDKKEARYKKPDITPIPVYRYRCAKCKRTQGASWAQGVKLECCGELMDVVRDTKGAPIEIGVKGGEK